MFITLLTVTFVVAFFVSFLLVRVFRTPLNSILDRIISDEISTAWGKYLSFAIYVVGISSGVRIWDLEKYITAPAKEGGEIVALNMDRWVLEIYRSVIGTLQGVAWMLLVFFMIALIAYAVIRVNEIKLQKQP